MVDYLQSIREAIPWIVSNYRYNNEATQRSKEVLHNLIVSLGEKQFSIQRLYLQYYMCQLMGHQDNEEAAEFFTTLFPLPLKKSIANFISQLLSLSISLNNKQILTACTLYIEKEQVKLNEDEISELPLTLAESSPTFAAALIGKGYFNTTSSKCSLYYPQLLANWLSSLAESSVENITFNGQSLIRYALLGPGQDSSELHFAILSSIQRKQLQPLSNQLVIDIATQLSQKGDIQLIEKFSQILVVGAQNSLCNTLVNSNQMKNTLKSLFANNALINAIDSLKSEK
ncbi:hypothetical protein B4U80_10460 [Leptotrombidium deliense]|uniref:Uncharacterized protein n=1 Tax=Leptotrombidium deliense TaxID=299467 RepID=A0A443SRV0_9ACAR|nr:hypothetical protein B4U80_10460 [Leptotrombidium deliense]